MEEIYKGFLIYDKKFYIELSEIDNSKKFYIKDGYLIENKESNRATYKMNEYYSNKTIFDAIDIYSEYKDKDVLKMPSSYIFDLWFNELKRDATSFKKTFGLDRIDKRFTNLNDCFEYWKKIISKDYEVEKFVTDEKIKSFFNIQIENDKILNSKAKRLDNLVW
jgi:hypothetical protein